MELNLIEQKVINFIVSNYFIKNIEIFSDLTARSAFSLHETLCNIYSVKKN